jgi:hypothetical protein
MLRISVSIKPGQAQLVAQSLKKHFRFVFVNTATREHLELDLADIFSRAKAIYPGWSIFF